MVQQTKCDAVMIGRAASSNPWIFAQIQEYLATGTYRIPCDRERYDLMRLYYNLLVERGEPDAIGKMKQFATYFTHGIRNGSKRCLVSTQIAAAGHWNGSSSPRSVYSRSLLPVSVRARP